MKTILVTGANGFIGKNLCDVLEEKGYLINKVLKDTSDSTIIKNITNSSLCIHLAGEVRPYASEEEHFQNNSHFTEKLIKLLGIHNNIPIIASSTIHAGLTNNKYGNSKNQAEKLILGYSKELKIDCNVLKLPHIFGPLCKPNYNSVVSTWIVNAINNQDLILYDEAKNIEMEYLYVRDLCFNIVDKINEPKNIILPKSHKIRLLDLKELILSIVEQGEGFHGCNEFETNLFNTITSYKDEY